MKKDFLTGACLVILPTFQKIDREKIAVNTAVGRQIMERKRAQKKPKKLIVLDKINIEITDQFSDQANICHPILEVYGNNCKDIDAEKEKKYSCKYYLDCLAYIAHTKFNFKCISCPAFYRKDLENLPQIETYMTDDLFDHVLEGDCSEKETDFKNVFWWK